MRKGVILLLWLLGILFPMAWLTRFSSVYDRLFEHLFNPLWTHMLMHAFLFAVLAYLLAQRMGHRTAMVPRSRVILSVLALVLVIALLQEGIQLLYKARPLGIDELLDVGIDLVGGSLGVMAFWWQAQKVCNRDRA